MSTKDKNALVSFEAELAKLASEAVTAETSSSGPAFLSTKGGQLTYRGNPIAGNELNVVILASPVERTYYTDRYDPTKPSGPACFAMAVSSQGLGPNSSSPQPQHSSCVGCPKDQWGSASNGGKGKACSEKRRLLILTEDSIATAESVELAEVAALRTPVTSVKPFGDYLQKIAILSKRPLSTVATKIKLVPDPKTQFKLQFDFVRSIEDPEVVQALLKRSKTEVERAVQTAGQEEEVMEVTSSSKF
jgi:hypothetical protein